MVNINYYLTLCTIKYLIVHSTVSEVHKCDNRLLDCPVKVKHISPIDQAAKHLFLNVLVMELFDCGQAALKFQLWYTRAEMGQSFLMCLDQHGSSRCW